MMRGLLPVIDYRLRRSGPSAAAWAVFLVMLTSVVDRTWALKCVCNPRECDIVKTTECPGKGLIIWDPCK